MENGTNLNVAWMSTPMVLPTYLLSLLVLRFALGAVGLPIFTLEDENAHMSWTATHIVHALVSGCP
jgi:hypothetical protein